MEKSSSKNQSMLKSIFNKDFIVGAITPVIIFSFFDKKEMTISGILFTFLKIKEI